MLINFKKGILNSFSGKHLPLFAINYCGLGVMGLQARVQAGGESNSNEIKALINITKSSKDIKNYLITTGISFGFGLIGIICNNAVIYVVKGITRDHRIRNKLKNSIFEITSPSIKYISTLFYLLPNGGVQSLSDIIDIISNRPKQLITNMVYYNTINQLRYHFILYINKKILNYYMKHHTDQSSSSSKRKLIKILYLVLSDPILSSITISLLVTPFRNLSNQYCKLLVESKSNQFSFNESNPINVFKQLVKEKGIISALYSGISLTFLMGILKLGL